MSPWIVQRLVGDAEPASEGERELEIRDLLLRVTIGAQREPHTGVAYTPNEALVRAITIRDFESDAGRCQHAGGALLARFCPELLEVKAAQRQREQRRMSQDVDRHLSREALEVGEVRFHVLVGCNAGKATRECVNQLSVRKPDAVQRSDAMGKAPHRIVRELAPESVVPAELPAAKDLIGFELVEVLAHLAQGSYSALH